MATGFYGTSAVVVEDITVLKDKAEAAASAAAASEANAATSESNASTSESNASTSETNSSNSESNAATSASNASTSEANSLLAVGYAEEWATTPEDTPVSVAAGGNGVSDFSALHWAAKSAASGGGAGTAVGTTYNNTDSTLVATNVKTALDELDTEKLESGDTVAALTITDLNLDEVTETVFVGAGGSVLASDGTWQEHTLVANQTPTFTLGAGQAVYCTFIIGAFTLTLSNVTKWVGGSAPATIGAEHGLVFWSPDGIAVIGMDVGAIS